MTKTYELGDVLKLKRDVWCTRKGAIYWDPQMIASGSMVIVTGWGKLSRFVSQLEFVEQSGMKFVMNVRKSRSLDEYFVRLG